MRFPVLENYLARLPHAAGQDTRVWLDSHGRVQGRYFNCTLTSAFQPVREFSSSRIAGLEAFLRSYSEQDDGLSLWKLLDQAASDEESIELDRLCRMLHAINFYRQTEAVSAEHADLYLSVHGRLLAGVSGNHGMAFRRILDGLGLPLERIVLQLPQITENQGWLLNYVADNYRLNGFRFAVNASDANDALHLLQQVRPDVVKVDAREIRDPEAARRLVRQAGDAGIRVVFKRVENHQVSHVLRQLDAEAAQAIHVQGKYWDSPWHALSVFTASVIAPDRAAASGCGLFAS